MRLTAVLSVQAATVPAVDTSDAPTSTTDSPAEPTVQSRMLAAGISLHDIRAYFAAGRVRLNGEPITDLDQPAPRPSAISIGLP